MESCVIDANDTGDDARMPRSNISQPSEILVAPITRAETLCYTSKTTCCVNRANGARNPALKMEMATDECVTPAKQPAVLTERIVQETGRSAWQWSRFTLLDQ